MTTQCTKEKSNGTKFYNKKIVCGQMTLGITVSASMKYLRQKRSQKLKKKKKQSFLYPSVYALYDGLRLFGVKPIFKIRYFGHFYLIDLYRSRIPDTFDRYRKPSEQ